MKRVLVLVLVASCRKGASEPEWDGTASFTCSGDRVVTLTGRKIKNADGFEMIQATERCQITLVDCDIEGDVIIHADQHSRVVIERGRIAASTPRNGSAISASDDASITVRGATVSGKTALSTSQNAHAVFEGGTLTGSENAISAWGASIVEMKGTTVDGPIFADKGVKITGVPEAKIGHQKDMPSIVSSTCGLVAHCYASTKQFGRIGGRVRVTVDAKGIISSTAIDRGDVPGDVKACLEGKKGTALEDAAGKAGTHTCEYDGRYLENDQGKMDWWPSFKADK